MNKIVEVDPTQFTICIVDDNPNNLQVIANYLDSQGFRVRAAQDGQSAIELLFQTKPDLILLDIMMPGLSGFDICKYIKSKPALQDIPVIFMTALADMDSLIKAFEVGAVDYITKPFRREEAKARIITHLKIRELTKIQQELLEMKERQAQELAELNANKDKFFSILSHDLRAPFSGVLSHAEFIMLYGDNLSREELIDATESIYGSTRVVFDLLENLLTWSRLQRNHLIYQPKHINLASFVREALVQLKEPAAAKMISLVNAIEDDELFVCADEYMLGIIIRNLLSNALKFTLSGGTVTVVNRRSYEKDRIQVSVIDTGIGMNRENLAKLFRIDVHHTTTGTSNEEGSGLGLILCQEMIERHGGQIWVESQLNRGTTFTFTLPTPNGSNEVGDL